MVWFMIHVALSLVRRRCIFVSKWPCARVLFAENIFENNYKNISVIIYVIIFNRCIFVTAHRGACAVSSVRLFF